MQGHPANRHAACMHACMRQVHTMPPCPKTHRPPCHAQLHSIPCCCACVQRATPPAPDLRRQHLQDCSMPTAPSTAATCADDACPITGAHKKPALHACACPCAQHMPALLLSAHAACATCPCKAVSTESLAKAAVNRKESMCLASTSAQQAVP